MTYLQDTKMINLQHGHTVKYYTTTKQQHIYGKRCIKDAEATNKYIALKLIKWNAFMQMSGVYINLVLFNEANFYCEESIGLWKSTKGSIDWLLKIKK